MEQNPQTPEQEPDYKLYTDTSLIEAAQSDDHFALLLEGLKKAEEIAAARPEIEAMQTVMAAAEMGVRQRIKECGYVTQEPSKSDPTES
jgi:hypothetical protein